MVQAYEEVLREELIFGSRMINFLYVLIKYSSHAMLCWMLKHVRIMKCENIVCSEYSLEINRKVSN